MIHKNGVYTKDNEKLNRFRPHEDNNVEGDPNTDWLYHLTWKFKQENNDQRMKHILQSIYQNVSQAALR